MIKEIIVTETARGHRFEVYIPHGSSIYNLWKRVGEIRYSPTLIDTVMGVNGITLVYESNQ